MTLDVSPDLARFLLGELPRCEGTGPFGCEAEGPAPGIVYVGRHLCDACAATVTDVDGGPVDAPHAAFVRRLHQIATSARAGLQ